MSSSFHFKIVTIKVKIFKKGVFGFAGIDIRSACDRIHYVCIEIRCVDREDNMKVLLTGNMSQISNLFISKLAEGYKCIIYNDKENYEFSGKNVINYCQQARDEEDMERIFSAHNFETVLFFSYALDGGLKVYDELEKLENVILESRKYKVKHFIYITTNDLKEERTAFTTEKSRNMIMKESHMYVLLAMLELRLMSMFALACLKMIFLIKIYLC